MVVLNDRRQRRGHRRAVAALPAVAVLAVALLASLLLASCSAFRDEEATGATEPLAPVPGAEPATASPDDEGVDPEVVASVADHAERQGADCFLVARNGRIIFDETWRGTGPDDPHGVFSVTKSIASMLIGILVADGKLAIDDRVSDHVPAWRDGTHDAITIRQVLSMTTGLERPDADYLNLAESQDRTATALALPVVAAPGSTWAYSNGAVQVLDAVVEAVAGEPTDEFAAERLFGPLGMDHTALHIDDAGNSTLAFGATTTCRDLARFGQLVLERGRWGDEQIVEEAWIDASTSSSSELNEGYGLLWWLNLEGRRLSSALAVSTDADEVIGTGRQVPDAPESLVWALGLGDQILQVDPGTQTVVVRVGRGQALDEPDRFDERATARIVTEGIER